MHEAVREQQRQDADGDVDEEDPAPVVVVCDPAAQDGANGGRRDDGDGVQSKGAGPLGGWEGIDQDGLFNGREAASADTLQDAGHQHDVERRSNAAEEAGDGEEGDAGHVVVLATEDAREPCGHRQDYSVSDEVGGEDPGNFIK
jgi:hypothetical protein